MMTSTNGNIFRITGPLCREFTGHPLNFPHKVTWSFDVFFDLHLKTVEWTFETLVIWYAIVLIMTSL